MKPHERTWEFHSGCWPEVVFYAGGNKKVCDVWADEDSSTCDVADLISAAPDMARLLVEAEWIAEEWDYGGGERRCYWCWSPAPYDQTCLFKGPRERCAPRRHKPDCAFIAVLRKAGVIADKERST